MRNEKVFGVEALDRDDVDLLRYLRRTFSCGHLRGDCPALPDCPEGFYLCDGVVNMLAPGQAPTLGDAARRALRYLYDQIDCAAAGDCPSRGRCDEASSEPCAAVMLKLGVIAE